jgi:hypothetical protein
LKNLENNQEYFQKFSDMFLKNKVVEVFMKESNGNQLKIIEDINFHICCTLASSLIKENDETFHNFNLKRELNTQRTFFQDYGLIIQLIRKKFNIKEEGDLTIIWRIDEIQKLIDEPQKLFDLKNIYESNDVDKEKNLDYNIERRSSLLYQYINTIMSVVMSEKEKKHFYYTNF